MDNNFNISRPASTKEVLEAITADIRKYNSKINEVKTEAESIKHGGKLQDLQRLQDLQETIFIHNLETRQMECKKFLADKSKEVEKLRQKFKHKKSAAEPAIEKFRDKVSNFEKIYNRS